MRVFNSSILNFIKMILVGNSCEVKAHKKKNMMRIINYGSFEKTFSCFLFFS